MKITKRQLKRIIKEEKARLLRESMEELPPPGHGRKSVVSTDATILVDDYIKVAVQNGLEEMGVTAKQANEIIRQLYNKPDMVIAACVNGLYDYKEKLARKEGNR